MDSNNPSGDGPKPIHLRLGSEKFFEIIIDDNTAEIYLMQANLRDGKIVVGSVEKIVDKKSSLEQAAGMMMDLINAKLDEGYELINEGEYAIGDEIRALEYKKVAEEKKKEEPKVPVVDSKPNGAHIAKIIDVSDNIWDFIDDIDAKAVQLNVAYEPMSGKIQLAGNETAVNELAQLIVRLHMCLEPEKEERKEEEIFENIQPDIWSQAEEKKEEEIFENIPPDIWSQVEEKKEEEIFENVPSDIWQQAEEEILDLPEKENEDKLGLYIQKELLIYPALKPHLKEIVTQAEKMQLIHEDLDNKILIAGFQTQVIDFMTWMYNFTAKALENITNEQKKMKYVKYNSEFTQDEVSVSTFHRVKKNEILKFAEDMELICDFGYDVILVTGQSDMIKEFKSYLHEIEAKAKKSLYPRYWDFHNIDIFSEIEINAFSEEFQEVEILLKHTLPTATVHKLTRIQNKYLMDHYVTMLQKRQELRPESVINRKMLFHGTRTIKPEEVYKNSDTGFDLQFANANGAYGKGLYFASGANYSHAGYVYNLGNGRFQMILADVFVGNAYKSNPNSALKKAPAGYDSVESTTHNFYVVYNNFHSYPLYLIEYECSGGPNNNNAFPGLFGGNINNANKPFQRPKTVLLSSKPVPVPLFGQQQQQQQQNNLFQNNSGNNGGLFNNRFNGRSNNNNSGLFG